MGKKRKASDTNGGNAVKAAKKEHVETTLSEQTQRGKIRRADKYQPKSLLLLEPRPDWHETELSSIEISDKLYPIHDDTLANIQGFANSLLQAENAAYSSGHGSASSSQKFLSTIMTSGTWEDKVSALTLLVQESPLHNMKAFETLLGLSKKKTRSQALVAVEAVKDLLAQGVVLPKDRKLRAFGRQPALLSAFTGRYAKWSEGDQLPIGLEKAHLICWAFEDWLKKAYFSLLTTLENWCNDEVEYSRKRALTFVFELLKEKPEQEENLLRLLVNKLGDKEKRMASRASYLILQLQVSHPAMKAIIIGAIESDLLFKPGQTVHAKYYAIITLNQTVLTVKEPEVADKLIAIYFSVFVALLKQIEKDDELPKLTKDGQIQGGGGIPGKKAQQKARKAAKAAEAANVAEKELNDKVVAQVLTGVNRAYPFADTNSSDFEKHLDTIFRITHSSNFNTSIQAFMLIQQISSAKHYSADRFYRTLYESLLDPRVLHSSKQMIYLNLLYKSLKADVSIRRVKAFVKRLLQILTMHEPPFICGVLYLISELESTFPSIRAMFTQPEENDEVDDALPNGTHTNNEREPNANTLSSPPKAPYPSSRYDPRKRDPTHSAAHTSCLWEILPFLTHYHPSVSLFATNLLSSLPPPTKPDPSHYTLIHFLDRFSYKNAKQKTTPKGMSLMQPLSGADTADRLLTPRKGIGIARGKEGTVNDERFWAKKVENVKEDEVFFHKYFEVTAKKKRGEERKREKRQKKRKGGDGEEEGSELDEEEDEIWKALVKSRPEVGDGGSGEEGFSEEEDFEGDMEMGSSDDDEELRGMMDGLEDDVDFDEGVDAEGGFEEVGEGEVGDAEEGDEEAPDLEDDDQDAFVESDEDLPSEFDGFGETGDEPEKVVSKSQEKRRERKKLKSLPTFASADDYSKYLGSDDEE